jgi:hypothetical protein
VPLAAVAGNKDDARSIHQRRWYGRHESLRRLPPPSGRNFDWPSPPATPQPGGEDFEIPVTG